MREISSRTSCFGTPFRELRSITIHQRHQRCTIGGRLVKIDEGLFFHSDVLAGTEQAMIDYLKAKGQMTVSEFRDLTGSSRKYVVPLLEHFYSKRITRRVGDVRVLARDFDSQRSAK